MKILLASEEVTARPSEGLLVYTMHLCRHLDAMGQLTVLHADGEPEDQLNARRHLSRGILLNRRLVSFLRNESFDVVIYIPSSGLTGFGLGRSLLLKSIANAPCILIALQMRQMGSLHRIFSFAMRPDCILSPVELLTDQLDRLGFKTGFTMPGFDETLFKPVDHPTKLLLRKKYGIPAEQYIVLHVGHVRESRNMQLFLRYREWGEDIQPVIKAGAVDPAWRDRLRRTGIIIIDEYVEQMQEIYQMADCYLFPVTNPTGALEFPLSVIEAAACNLPVLTTPFGSLPQVICEGGGLLYFETALDIPSKLLQLKKLDINTSAVVSRYSWTSVFEKYIDPYLHGFDKIRRK